MTWSAAPSAPEPRDRGDARTENGKVRARRRLHLRRAGRSITRRHHYFAPLRCLDPCSVSFQTSRTFAFGFCPSRDDSPEPSASFSTPNQLPGAKSAIVFDCQSAPRSRSASFRPPISSAEPIGHRFRPPIGSDDALGQILNSRWVRVSPAAAQAVALAGSFGRMGRDKNTRAVEIDSGR